MDLWHAVIYGIVEGITEFLPVSSTGHLILTSKILQTPQTDFLSSFEIAIQVGAILAVVALYWRKLLLSREIFMKLVAAFIPTAVIGFVLYKIIKKIFMGNQQVVLWSLLIGGIIIIIFELLHKEDKCLSDDVNNITLKQAVLIGLFQSLSMIPGVSRSAATIIGGLSLGISRKAIVEFSFLLAVPTMLAASGYDLLKNGFVFSQERAVFLGVGFIVSFIVAILSIKSFLYYVKRYNFIGFGIYRIIAAILFWWIM
jgi:undecaprenyl-diphosphatase